MSKTGKNGQIDKNVSKKIYTPSNIGKVGKRGKIAEVDILSN